MAEEEPVVEVPAEAEAEAEEQPAEAAADGEPAQQEEAAAAEEPQQQQDGEEAPAEAAEEPAPAAAPAPAIDPAAVAAAAAKAAALAAQFAAHHQAHGGAEDAGNKRRHEDYNDEEPSAKRHGGEAALMSSGVTFGPGGEASDTIQVPANKIGRLVGRAGATIKVIQDRGMCRLKIDHNATGDYKPVTITGSVENIATTRRLIADALESNIHASDAGHGGGGGGGGGGHASTGAGGHGGEASRKITCPTHVVGRVIGRGGETIRSLQNASSAHIVINQNFPEGQPREIEISGRPDAVETAYKMIMDLISTEGSTNTRGIIEKHGQGLNREIQCPKGMVGRIIGKGGETIKGLQSKFTVSIQIDQNSTPCKVTVTGPPGSVQAAERAILDLIEDRGGPGGPGGYGGGRGPPPGQGYGGHGGPPPYGGGGGGYGAPPPAYGGGGYGAPPPAYGGGGGYGAPPPAYGGYGAPAGGYGAPAPAPAPAPQPGAYGGGYGGYPQPAAADPYGAPGGYGAPAAAPAAYGQPQHHPQQAQHHGHAPQAQPPAAAPPPARPPSVWTEMKDDQQRSYYYNTQTGVSQWERPADM